jgi:YbbR domain-containing protein
LRRFASAILRFIAQAFSQNLGLKSLSLVVALGLVAYTRGQLDDTQRTIPVGVVLRLPPDSAKRELMTQIPPNIHVTLLGPTRAIDGLIQTGVPPVEIDLRDGHTSSIVFEPSLFSLPMDVEVKIIDPPSLPLEWQDVVTRALPVQASRTGQPAKGYEVKDRLAVEPTEVNVRGPQSLVETMQFARLAAFDVTGLTEGVYRRRLAIDNPPPRVRFVDVSTATVTATIIPRRSETKFPRVEVQVTGGPRGVKCTPREVDVTVTGPPELVALLRVEQILPTADLAKAGIDTSKEHHGTAEVQVGVSLAGGATAEVQPPSVAVRW